jgi:pyruvate dehydrogenase E1 component alpha subunit
VEARTYRSGGHSRADPGKYRPDAEVAAWGAYDPVTIYRARLTAAGVPDAELDGIDAQAAAEVDEATEAAKQGEAPGPDLLMKDVWADGGASWRN